MDEMHAEQFDIPMFSFMQKEQSPIPQVILVAEGKGFTEQFILDGSMDDGEKFEDRINLVLSNTKKLMPNLDIKFYYYKEYSNGIFNYKLYFQDAIIDTHEGKKITRAINAYFVEPRMKDFYQFSLSTEPLLMPPKILNPDKVDLQNDKMTIALNSLMKDLLDNLKYKN